MTEFKKPNYAKESRSALDYEFYAETKSHHRCMWNDHGDRCMNAASRLTTVQTTKTKQLPGGPHISVIRGGYCPEHFLAWETKVDDESESEARPRGARDWRDVLIDSALDLRREALK